MMYNGKCLSSGSDYYRAGMDLTQKKEVETTVYACEYLGDHMFKSYGRLVSMDDLSGEQRDAHYNRIREEFDNRISEIGNRLRNRAGDLVVDFGESERSRDDNGIIVNDGNSNNARRIGSDDKGNSSLSDDNNETTSDGGIALAKAIKLQSRSTLQFLSWVKMITELYSIIRNKY